MKNKVAIVSCWDNSIDEIAQITWKTKEAYCQRHGYNLFRGSIIPGRHPSWSKVYTVKYVLVNHDFVFCLDADAMIAGDADVVELLGDKDFAITLDMNGINGGNWIVRNCDWSFAFLDRVWNMYDRFATHPWNEQLAYGAALQTTLEDIEHVHFLANRAINSNPVDCYPDYPWPEGQWQPGDFILHMSGLSNEKRFEALRKYGLI